MEGEERAEVQRRIMPRFEHGGNVYACPGCMDFSANLNPLGMPASVRSALMENVDAFTRYPDPACTDLVAALAEFERVPRAWVVATAGATDAFERLCQLVKPREALLCSPCYAGYEQALGRVGSSVTCHALRAERSFDAGQELVDALDRGVDLAFLANPNNPTGRCLQRDVLVAFLERARRFQTVVALDECFIDLTECAGSNDLLADNPSLVIVKAFTKSFALAGLRIGYALCADEELVRRLREVGQTWAVGVPAQIAGVACASCREHLCESRRLVAHERARLYEALDALRLHVVEGQANFLLFEGPASLGDDLLARKILIRSCANFSGLGDRWWRIAVRTPEENDELIAAMGEVLR